MARIPSHTIVNAPDAARPILERLINVSPTGRLLNMHAQLAHSPAALAAYVSIREASDQHGTLDPRVTMRQMIPGVTILSLGVETIFASFFLSVLGINRKPPQ